MVTLYSIKEEQIVKLLITAIDKKNNKSYEFISDDLENDITTIPVINITTPYKSDAYNIWYKISNYIINNNINISNIDGPLLLTSDDYKITIELFNEDINSDKTKNKCNCKEDKKYKDVNNNCNCTSKTGETYDWNYSCTDDLYNDLIKCLKENNVPLYNRLKHIL